MYEHISGAQASICSIMSFIKDSVLKEGTLVLASKYAKTSPLR